MKERISALLDGDVDAQAMEPVLGSVRASADVRRQWDRYCLIGDALRGEVDLSQDLTARVMARLEDEPTVLVPVALRRNETPRPSWRKLMPLAASVAGVAVVGWLAFPVASDSPANTAAIQMARMTPAPMATKVVADDKRDNEPLRAYLFAHQSLSNQGAIPAVAPFVRTVAEVSPGAQR
ncbi:sigma-E factor negative regulatory protein [Denitromonas iodatirespirans]|uniref:Sigma-E factor negative regulatory protein n=1 Tax=Denitromonas iodatirespirans TaxID=2795389 RepID=A0A944H8H7_DENI1|nr:sigma-E factor negative regulatory protein [Denitromonas iodatirespirans]MBT0961390.1 sigma-E factor negative regulatory protein [Denitromonas iodatirespirans]